MSVRIEVADGVGVLTLDEPDRRNALNLDMVKRVTDAFDEFESQGSGVGAVIVTGAPPAFCAGADLGDLGAQKSTDDRERELRATVGDVKPGYHFERDVENFFRHSPAVVRNPES